MSWSALARGEVSSVNVIHNPSYASMETDKPFGIYKLTRTHYIGIALVLHQSPIALAIALDDVGAHNRWFRLNGSVLSILDRMELLVEMKHPDVDDDVPFGALFSFFPNLHYIEGM